MKANCKLYQCLCVFLALACASGCLGQDANSDILNILAEDDHALPSAENESIYNGQKVPNEVKLNAPWGSTLGSSDKSILIIHYQTDLLKEQGVEALVKMLETYSNELPPTKRDMIIYSATKRLLYNSRRGDRVIGPIPAESWTPLANVKNPVYRYLSFYAIITAQFDELASESEVREIFQDINSVDRALMYRVGDAYFDMLSQFFDEEDVIF